MMKPIVPPPFFTFSILIVTQFAPSPLLTKALLNLYAAQGIFFEKMATAICCQRNLHPVSFFFFMEMNGCLPFLFYQSTEIFFLTFS